MSFEVSLFSHDVEKLGIETVLGGAKLQHCDKPSVLGGGFTGCGKSPTNADLGPRRLKPDLKTNGLSQR